ncbi:PpiC-type peptidyl-prolyl cis-trans isomerase [Rippkaea orientalis PCC 8801]|uniref:peptidylprolyl isomerase n=1 Tax=Rippkaea orientalis (strain PCC 8801 / RF-1) TaxID=41431 RepID=B7K5F0_RIPO1|nr:peptidylprolyl isomerase [Rippkaea orientalis]ACK66683.1 PpiC-type peptidyl-prolyl cis-trans isomerase [Rippkaea orientalis PCC 8801]
MSLSIAITDEEILKQVKLSGKIPEIIEGIINRQIITEEATNLGIKVETEELQQAADQFRLSKNLHSANDTHQWLEKNQLSVDDFEEMLYCTILSGKLANHLFNDQIEAYFYQNQLNYAEVVMYEVILDNEDLAMELYYAIDEEEMSFWDVAHHYIQDQELRRKGGYLETVKRQDLKPEISAAVFAATPPELLKPIMTSQGVHLVFVEEIIQPVLNEKKRYQILADLFSQWVKQKSEEITIVDN